MEKLLTIEQVAEVLQVKKSTIYSLVCRKRIPHVKITGKILRFKLSELQKWIESANRTSSDSNHIGKKTKTRMNSKGTVSNDGIERLIQQARKDLLNQ